jgi:hypothetical protein
MPPSQDELPKSRHRLSLASVVDKQGASNGKGI